MSARSAGPGAGRDGGRRPLLALLVLVVLVVLAALAAGPGREGPPLDPRSTGPDGTRALVEVLRELGARVEQTARPGERDDVALLLSDRLGERDREELGAWVRAGGRLVVTDAGSPLSPEPVAVAGGLVGVPLARDCDLPALTAVEQVRPGASSALYIRPAGAQGCFPRGAGHWLVVEPRGRGAVVALGGPEVLVNAQLGDADHGLLAATLLAPEPGTRVAFLRPPLPGEGEAGLAELISPGVRAGVVQLLVAFLLLVAWRARRLGRPLEEPQPVRVPGSELVAAVGNLLHQARAVGRAAVLLRADARRLVAERLGLPPATPPEQVVEVLVARAGVDRDEAHRALAGPQPADEAGLVELAGALERLRAALDGRPATAGAHGQAHGQEGS